MSLFETNIDNKEVDHTMEQIEDDLIRVLNGKAKQVSFEEFYRALYIMLQNDYGNLVQTITQNKIEEVFSQQLDSIQRESNSLKNIYQTFNNLLLSIEKLSKIYFYFQETYYQAEKNTSLKIISYNKLKTLLVKKEDLFVQFLSQLIIFIFKIKNGIISQQNDVQLMNKILGLIKKLDNQTGQVHIFNDYLKDLYIRHLVKQNSEKITRVLQNQSLKEYFQIMKTQYYEEQLFISQYFSTFKTKNSISEIMKEFYANWITQSWSFITNKKQDLQSVLKSNFLTVYDAVKLDSNGLKQFTLWYVDVVSQKLNKLDIKDNESLVKQFSNLYNSIFKYIKLQQNNPLIGKVRLTLQNWLNTDSMNIVNRLINRINYLLFEAFELKIQPSQFQQSLLEPMLIFKFIKEKDMFELAYGKTLLERMTSQKYSKVLQETTLKLIRLQCGESWTSKIQAIIIENQKNVDANIISINQTHWQTLTNKQPHVHDSYLSEFYKDSKALEGKDSKWLLNYGSGILRMHLAKSFDLKVSTKSMQLLVYFNQNNTLVIKDYLLSTKYDIETLKPSILCLIKSQIILSNLEVKTQSDINNNITLTLNVNYSPKEQVVIVMQQKESEILNLGQKQQLTEDRKLIIQGVITKLIKMAKTSTKDQLIQQAVKVIDKKGFSATLELIASVFPTLQNRGFINIEGNVVTYIP